MDFRDVFRRAVVDAVRRRVPSPGGRRTRASAATSSSSSPASGSAPRSWAPSGSRPGTTRASRRDPGGGAAQLWAAVDAAKDQSYFLFAIEPAVLQRTLFPLGELTQGGGARPRPTFGLPVAEKPESQEICFVPQGGYAAFVAAQAGATPGRAGASSTATADRRPPRRRASVHHRAAARPGRERRGAALYVTDIDAASGTVRVGPRAATVAAGLVAARPNWLSGAPVPRGARLHMKIRSRFAPAAVTHRANRRRRLRGAVGGRPAGGDAGAGGGALRRRARRRRRVDRARRASRRATDARRQRRHERPRRPRRMRELRVAITTLGCKVNQYDTRHHRDRACAARAARSCPSRRGPTSTSSTAAR